jgi:hypothetical protein
MATVMATLIAQLKAPATLTVDKLQQATTATADAATVVAVVMETTMAEAMLGAASAATTPVDGVLRSMGLASSSVVALPVGATECDWDP